MAVELIPWMVKGGKHSANVGRMLAYAATQGAEGVSGVGDLVVKQAAVAAGKVTVGAGGAVILNRYPGARNETYIGRVTSTTDVTVPANASGATRYDLVIARIDDWNYAGAQPEPAAGSLPTDTVPVFKLAVISGVAAATKTAAELNLNYPAIALARIAIPAGTSAITQAMITPLREVANPRRKRDLRAVGQLPGRNNTLASTAAEGEQFPNDGVFTMEVPAWASQAKIVATLSGIVVLAGTAYGITWVRFGHGRADVINTQPTAADFTSPRNDPSRVTTMSADTINIPASMRGQSITVLLMGRKMSGSTNLGADANTAFALDVEFVEAPAEDL